MSSICIECKHYRCESVEETANGFVHLYDEHLCYAHRTVIGYNYITGTYDYKDTHSCIKFNSTGNCSHFKQKAPPSSKSRCSDFELLELVNIKIKGLEKIIEELYSRINELSDQIAELRRKANK